MKTGLSGASVILTKSWMFHIRCLSLILILPQTTPFSFKEKRICDPTIVLCIVPNKKLLSRNLHVGICIAPIQWSSNLLDLIICLCRYSCSVCNSSLNLVLACCKQHSYYNWFCMHVCNIFFLDFLPYKLIDHIEVLHKYCIILFLHVDNTFYQVPLLIDINTV